MDPHVEAALDTASRLGASYADVRIVTTRTQTVSTRSGEVAGLLEERSRGLGVRALVKGAWGFSSSAEATPEVAHQVAAQAVAIATASGRAPGPPVDLGPPEIHVGAYETPVARDPFSVPLEQKVDLLLRADAAAQREHVSVVRGSLVAIREDKLFASSEGSRIEQRIFETGGGLEVTAVGHGDTQKRSYPNSFGRHQGTAGWELVEAMNLVEHAEPTAAEAVALLTAKACEPGRRTIILDGTQVALQVHESCGHPIELDRVFGTEAAYAGTSFLTPDRLTEAFEYGSEVVNLTADATLPGGLGTFGYDDEGVPAQRTPIVRSGRFVGYLTSRETAAQLHALHGPWPERSNGSMRASGWNRIPLIRMTNVSLEAGDAGSLDDLVADTADGILMHTNKSWSIDDRRLNFQFGTEAAWEVRRGRRGALLKNATYTGSTPQFWGSCDAVCGGGAWNIWGTPNCGKGQPGQVAHTGHGAAPARFRDVRVGVA